MLHQIFDVASNPTSNVGVLRTKQMAVTVTRLNVVFTPRYALISCQKHHHHPKIVIGDDGVKGVISVNIYSIKEAFLCGVVIILRCSRVCFTSNVIFFILSVCRSIVECSQYSMRDLILEHLA